MKQIKVKNNPLVENILGSYLSLKEGSSRNIYKACPKEKKHKVTFFKNAKDELNKISLVNGYIQKNFKYIADPLTFDYYTHPEMVQYELNNNIHGQYGRDCDDYACFAYASLLASGIPADNISVVTILPNLFPNITNIQWCHVILLGYLYNKQPDVSGNCWAYTIDTNGLFFYQFNPIEVLNTDIVYNKILKKFSTLYPTEYTLLVDHGYPF